VTVQHARHLKIALNVLGVKAGLVHGEMKSDERAQVLADFREGKLQALTNVAVLTEGFDDPAVSCVAMARPTKSQSLYVQCVGRGTRLAEGKTDCLVLDFADVSEQSVVTLPSLYGMPREFDLEGEDAGEVAGKLQKMFMDVPGFEWEAGAITLAEIQRRAESFDPLTLDIDPELRAISGHAWCSLGSSGLVLHVHLRKEKLSEYLILDSRRKGKERYQVMLDQAPVATFSQIQEAVAAVDWEVEQRGPLSAQSARPEAAWRQRPPPPKLVEQLQALTPPRSARTTGEAMHYVAFGMYARKRRLPRQH
jgi:hypothetical protein